MPGGRKVGSSFRGACAIVTTPDVPNLMTIIFLVRIVLFLVNGRDVLYMYVYMIPYI
jgi:hypothetical protein